MSISRDERTEPSPGRERAMLNVDVSPQTGAGAPPAEAEDLWAPPLNHFRPSVELHIEELLLNGFDPLHGYAIGDAIERELARLLIEQGPPMTANQALEVSHLNHASLEIRAGSSPETIGRQLGKAIHRGLR